MIRIRHFNIRFYIFLGERERENEREGVREKRQKEKGVGERIRELRQVSHLYDSDIGIDGGIVEYIEDIALPNAWWFILSRDGDSDGTDICEPPIKLLCISVGVGVPDPATVVLMLVLVVCVIPEDRLVLPTLVGVRR